MTGFVRLRRLAEERAEEALRAWQRLDAQCAGATAKLDALERHRAAYQDRLDGGLAQGAASGLVAAQFAFIGQIEAVALRQHGELTELEAARARQWQELLSVRRERRIYEILGERAAADAAAQARRRGETRSDEVVQRAAARPPALSLRDARLRGWQ
jgi:flagellar export protein FliJ